MYLQDQLGPAAVVLNSVRLPVLQESLATLIR